MSRLGKLPISVPKGVQVKMDGNKITVKGPKGSLTKEVIKEIQVQVSPEEVVVSLTDEAAQMGNFHGLWRQLINNMVLGTTVGFEKKLQMIGVGYRAAVQGRVLDVQVGYSHPTQVAIPEGIEVKVEKNTAISITGIDKQKVGQFAANVRSFRPPEPYKGKGIRYEEEYVRRKAGKSGKK
ncbi:MAG: 50S ribosomal protein L6 [Chlamydiales bacterium]|nr:50S ribosomal protein L6 [Chlamydiales bacterium]